MNPLTLEWEGKAEEDCVSFVMMKEFSLRETLSKDRHFQEAGFHPLLLE